MQKDTGITPPRTTASERLLLNVVAVHPDRTCDELEVLTGSSRRQVQLCLRTLRFANRIVVSVRGDCDRENRYSITTDGAR